MGKTLEKDRINTIIESIMKVARGDYSVQVELSGKNDELDSLAMGLNMMIDDIRTSKEELEKIYQELQATHEASLNIMEDLDRQGKELSALNKQLQQEITERKHAEETLRLFSHSVESSVDGMAMGDLNGKITYVNQAFVKMLGYSKEELIGKEIAFIHAKDEIPKLNEAIKATMEGGWIGELIGKRKDGELFPIAVSSSRVMDDKGNVIAIMANHRDITERKRAEEELRSSEERLRILFEYAPDAYYLSDLKGNFVDGNKAAEEITGYRREELIGKSFLKLKLLSPRQIPKAAALLAKNVLGQATGPDEFILNRKDGTQIPVEIRTFPVKIEGKTLVLGIARDITERKRLEEALRLFSHSVESSVDGMAMGDLNGKITYVNQAFVRMSGYSKEELIGKEIAFIHPEDQIPKLKEAIKATMEGGWTGELIAKRKGGELFPIAVSSSRVADDKGNIIAIMANHRDITERKKREQLQHDENYVLTLLGQGAELSELLDAIVRLGEYHDPSIKGSVLLFDPSRECLVQASAPSLPDDYNELLKNGLPIGPNVGSCGTAAYLKERVIVSDIENSPLFKPFEEAVKRAISNGLLSCWSQPIISSNGDLLGTIANYSNKLGEPNADSLRVLEWSARIAAISIERKQAEQELQKKNEQLDAQNEELRATEEELRAANEELQATNEELRDAQEKLVRSERLAAIGQLAGGVGHELRNPLSAIKNAVYYVRGKVAKSELGQKEPQVIEFLDIMDDEINSSSKIINDLLGFSRVGKPTVSPTRIERVIDDALSYTTIPENIELTKKLDTDLPEVKIDTDQVRQVLVNMILNAVQAMPTGGKLTINAKEKDKFLEVEITDTGCGMPHEVMVKIFDPLFTTRAKGIGLGLAVCKAIIDRHAGYIEVKSEVEKGTTFIIKLPLRAE